MERCPVCRARIRDTEGPCRRCRTDLQPLRHLVVRASRLECKAVHALIGHRYDDAVRYVREARKLRVTPFLRCLDGFVQEMLKASDDKRDTTPT